MPSSGKPSAAEMQLGSFLFSLGVSACEGLFFISLFPLRPLFSPGENRNRRRRFKLGKEGKWNKRICHSRGKGGSTKKGYPSTS